ncbi:MAG: methyltransferase domain-containing protein [Proteobacteria bacterium]|nr:MAG: methyltransferase domain-containing protein [Pseudomonadota bacterium]
MRTESEFGRHTLGAASVAYDVPRSDASDIMVLNPWISPVQVLEWANRVGFFESMVHGPESSCDICEKTGLTERGFEALAGVTLALELIRRSGEGRYELTTLSREYLLPDSPFFVGFSLFRDVNRPIPDRLIRRGQSNCLNWLARASRRLTQRLALRRSMEFGSPERLREQNSRNLAATALAASHPEFDHPTRIVDVGGGSGTFAIPLATRRRDVHITLIELPDSIANTRSYLDTAGVGDRVDVIGMDVLDAAATIPECDCVFFGNFVHGFSEQECVDLFGKCRNALKASGSIWIHEHLWDENKEGPLLTALWHVVMMANSASGRQRSWRELVELMELAGFEVELPEYTACGFSLVRGRVPEP